MPFLPTAKDDVEDTLVKGTIYGGLLLSSLYGLNELRKFLVDKLNLEPSVYHKNVKKVGVPYEEMGKVASEGGVYKQFLFGMGLPLGAFGVYHLLDYLSAQNHAYQVRNLARKLEISARSETPNTEYTQKPHIAEFEKMNSDKEIDSFIKKAIFESDGKDVVDQSNSVAKLLLSAITDYYPAILGSLVPLGFLSGYYGSKAMFTPAEDMAKEVDPLAKQPEFVASYVPKSEKNVAVSFSTFDPKQVALSKKGVDRKTFPEYSSADPYGMDLDYYNKAKEDYHKSVSTTPKSNALVLSGVAMLAKGVLGGPPPPEKPIPDTAADNFKFKPKKKEEFTSADGFKM